MDETRGPGIYPVKELSNYPEEVDEPERKLAEIMGGVLQTCENILGEVEGGVKPKLIKQIAEELELFLYTKVSDRELILGGRSEEFWWDIEGEDLRKLFIKINKGRELKDEVDVEAIFRKIIDESADSL